MYINFIITKIFKSLFFGLIFFLIKIINWKLLLLSSSNKKTPGPGKNYLIFVIKYNKIKKFKLIIN